MTLETTNSTQFELNERISDEGMDYLSDAIYRLTLHALPKWFSPSWTNSQVDGDGLTRETPVGPKPIKYNGKIMKRIGQYLHARNIPQPTTTESTQIGSKLAQHRIPGHTVDYDITDRFDWQDGDFGDSGSCYWGEYAAARHALEERGARALRFFENGDGIGRAWLAPLNEFDEYYERPRFLLFNAYSKRDTYLHNAANTLQLMALIASRLAGDDYTYKKVNLYNMGQSDGTVYINGGSAFLIGPTDNMTGSCFDLGIEDLGETCTRCGYTIHDGERYYVENYGDICESCYCDNYSYCEDCDTTVGNDEIRHVTDHTTRWNPTPHEAWICEHCFDQSYITCESCDKDTSKENAYEAFGDDYCQDCALDKFSLCDDCNEFEYHDRVTRDRASGELLCRDCLSYNSDILAPCQSCAQHDEKTNMLTATDGSLYCQDCSHMALVTCDNCLDDFEADEVHKHNGETFYCFDCQPTLPTMEIA